MSEAFDHAAGDVTGQLPTFTCEGETFTLHGAVSVLDLSELVRMSDVDSDSPEGAAALAEFFRAAFGDDLVEGKAEYRRFRRHVRRLDSDITVAAVSDVVAAMTGFPTQQPSESSPSQPTTTPGSRADGSAPDAQARMLSVIEGEVVSEGPRVNLGRTGS